MTATLLLALTLAGPRLSELPVPALAARQLSDAEAVALYRQGALRIVAWLDSRPDLVPAEKLDVPRLLGPEARAELVLAWRSFLDYTLALDSLAQYHQDFFRLRGAARSSSLLVLEAAWGAEYRSALEWIHRAERDRGLHVVLNEEVAEIGLPRNTYQALKSRFLDLRRPEEAAALDLLRKTLSPADPKGLSGGIAEDRRALLRLGLKGAPVLAIKNAWGLVKGTGFRAWFPVQAGVGEWMGDTKVKRVGISLVSPQQIADMRLQPGDILLERREWYLSNVGLPGFWPHTALYIGTPEERARYFEDPAVRTWARLQGGDGPFEELLRERAGDAYVKSLAPYEGHAPRVLEAVSEGVSFTSLEHSAAADTFAVLRPRLARTDKAAALLAAFQYAGRPYDFNFDFRTDRELVCSELVYKAYAPAAERPGLKLPLVAVLGRPTLPPNEIVRMFDAAYGTADQQFDLVLFLDGQEKLKRAVPASVEEFRASWKRPKWHLFTKEGRGE